MSLMGAYAKDDYLTREELRALPVPPAIGPRHHPVGFGEFVDLVDDELARAGLRVASEEHYTQADYKRHFGLLTLATGDGVMGGDGWTMLLGLKGSHDQTSGRGMVMGRHVTVCSNGMFTGDLGSLITKQSTFIWDRLRDLVRLAVGRIWSTYEQQQLRNTLMQQKRLAVQTGDALLVEMYRAGAFSGSQLARSVDQWREPEYEEHKQWGQSLWLLEQAATQALKPTGATPVSPAVLENRTRRVGTVIDQYLEAA